MIKNQCIMQPAKKKEIKEVISKKYHLVIGFEVNGIPGTFTCKTKTISRGRDSFEDTTCIHDIDKGDYGHNFFYISDPNGFVIRFFSFGPVDFYRDKIKGTEPTQKDYAKRRPSTVSYKITELSSLFRFVISNECASRLINATDNYISKKNDYIVYQNITCASEAKSILDAAGINTPSGSSGVHAPSLGEIGGSGAFNLINFINPYMWYNQITKKYGSAILFISNKGHYINYKYIDKYIEQDSFSLAKLKQELHWDLKQGDKDPLVSHPNAASNIKIHGYFS